MRGHDIIVIGTSAGGVGTLQDIFRGLPSDIPAAIFVVLHLTPHVPSFLSEVLIKAGKLPVTQVTGPIRFRNGHVYVAPPDHHLILTRTLVDVNRGPRENWHRPSVDVLFRSAATALGPRVAGVVLTGFLDDGSAGLEAIHKEGGITIVQDPSDAAFPDMPMNALQSVPVNHCAPVSELPQLLMEVARKPAGRRPRPRPSPEVATETAIAKMSMNGRKVMDRIGRPSTFTCPECEGPLWEMKDGKMLRFRCQVGHAFSAESMVTAQQDVVKRALWVALGAIESRVALWRRIAARMKNSHLMEMARYYRSKEHEARRDMNELRRILTQNGVGTPRGRRGGSRRPGAGASGASAATKPRARRLRKLRMLPRTSAMGG